MTEPVRLPDRRPEPRRTGLTVFVRALAVDAFIGVHAHEKGRAQPLVVDVDLDLSDLAVRTLADTVNYETVSTLAHAIAASGHVDLVEEYAERLALACLDDARIKAVRVRVEKPRALQDARAAGCEVAFARG